MKRYKSLIRVLPYREQLGRSKKSIWVGLAKGKPKYAKNFIKLFGENDVLELSRADLFDSAKKDTLDTFIAKVIMWGYPRGPRGKNFEHMCEHIESIKKALRSAKSNIVDWDKHFQKISGITGIGMSTYTKLLYFKGIKVHGLEALILDIRVINSLKRGVFTELDEVSDIRNSNAHNKYPNYLSCAHKISNKLNVEPDRVELFLFQYGDSLKI